MRSTAESFPELLGIEATPETQAFRAQNPVLGVASQIAGAFVPYVGAAKALRILPLARDAIAAAEGLGGTSKILSGAFGVGAETAGVELGRLGISATPLPGAVYQGVTGITPEKKPFGDQLGEAAFNVGTGAILGGAIGGIAARFAKGRSIADITGLGNDAPVMLQARRVDDLVSAHEDPTVDFKMSDDAYARLTQEKQNLIKANLLGYNPRYSDTGETLPGPDKLTGTMAEGSGGAKGKAYFPLEGDNTSNDQVANFLNRTYAGWRGASPDKLTTTRRVWADQGTAKRVGTYFDPNMLASDLTSAGVDLETLGTYAQDVHTVEIKAGQQGGKGKNTQIESNLDQVQDPDGLEPGQRLLGTTEDSTLGKGNDPAQARASTFQKRLTSKAFTAVGDGWHMATDDQGMSVMSKKVAGDPDVPAPGDRWMILRTDAPGQFAKSSDAASKVQGLSGYFVKPEEYLKINEPIYQAGVNDLNLTKTDVLAKISQQKTEVGAMARDMLSNTQLFVQPTTPLAQKNPLSARLQSLYHSLTNQAEQNVVRQMKGEHIIPDNKIAGGILSFKGDNTGQGLEAAIKEFTEQDRKDFQTILDLSPNIDRVRELALTKDINGEPVISDRVKNFFEAKNVLDQLFTGRMDELTNNLKLDAAHRVLTQFQQRQGHYGYTRNFTGAVHMLLHDDAGEVAGIAPGHDWASARERAADTVKYWSERGKNLTVGGGFDTAELTPEMFQELKGKLRRPSFIKSRIGMLGYDSGKTDLTNKDIIDLTTKNLRTRENFIRDAVAADLGAPLVERLKLLDPKLAQRMEQSRQIMSGDEGKFAQAQNAMADKVVHALGFNGKDTASGIVRETQRIINHFQFNWLNIAAPVTNMVGIMQTLLPNVAMVMHGDPEILARNYYSLPLLNGAGAVKGGFHALSEIKVMKNAFALLGKTPKQVGEDYQELLENLTQMRVINPRFAEVNMGTDGAILADPLGAFKSGKSFLDYLKSSNVMMMQKSEELSRLVSVNAAYELAKLMGLDGRRMAIFARNMVEKTNYNYGAMDRALMFTTPIGSLAGTMKNWMFHYMSSMLEFASAGRSGILPLMWQTGSTALLGGAAATPLAMPLANAFSQFFTNKDFTQNLYDYGQTHGLPDSVADGIIYGLPATMGVSLTTQLASPGSDPLRDAQMIYSFAAFDRMKSLSSGVRDGLAAYAATGASPFEDGKARDEIIRGLLPRTMFRAMATTSDGAVKSMTTGYDVTKPMGLAGAALYWAGFTPTALAKTYDVYNQIKDDQAKQKDLTKQMGQDLYEAVQNGDDRLANRIYTRAIAVGLDTGSLMRSVTAREGKQDKTQLEQVATPAEKEAYAFMFRDEQ